LYENTLALKPANPTVPLHHWKLCRRTLSGVKAGDEKGETARLPFELRAIELDPNFALAYLSAGEDYLNGAGPTEKANEFIGKAFELQDHATAAQKLQIESTYYVAVTGELDKVAETYQRALAIYPRSSEAAYTNLSIVHSEQGRYEKAAEMARQAIPQDPNDGRLYGNLAHCLLALQRFGEAREAIQTALLRKPDNDANHEDLYALAFSD
jgi:tetratricopeptide (TPR) repeat protein